MRLIVPLGKGIHMTDRRDGTINPDDYYESGRAATDYRIQQLNDTILILTQEINDLRAALRKEIEKNKNLQYKITYMDKYHVWPVTKEPF